MSRRAKLAREAFRARVRQMVEAGWTDARIVKETGATLAHVQRVAGQERAAIGEGAFK